MLDLAEIKRQGERLQIQAENFKTATAKVADILQSLETTARTGGSDCEGLAKVLGNLKEQYKIVSDKAYKHYENLSKTMLSYVTSTSFNMEEFESSVTELDNSIAELISLLNIDTETTNNNYSHFYNRDIPNPTRPNATIEK